MERAILSDDGWTKSYRRKWRHPVFRNFRDAAVWAYLTDNAAWADNTDTRFDGERIVLMAGEIAVSERFLAEGFACDRQVIRRIFDALEKDQMIHRRKTHRSTIITICNYRQYQAREEIENPQRVAARTQPEPSANPNIEETKNITVVVSREQLSVARDAVLKAVGADRDPNCRLNGSLVEVWLKRGFDLELDILATINRIMSQGPPIISSLKFFDNAIARAFADRNRSIPEPHHANGHRPSGKPSRRTAEDALGEIRRAGLAGAGAVEPFHDPADGPIIEHVAACH
jgi:hypothetical protein